MGQGCGGSQGGKGENLNTKEHGTSRDKVQNDERKSTQEVGRKTPQTMISKTKLTLFQVPVEFQSS